MALENPEKLAQRIGLTPQTLESRKSVLGLSEADRELLKNASGAVKGNAKNFLDNLYSHFARFEELNSLLGNESQIERLKVQQEKYLLELFESPINWNYALSRVVIGAIHYKVGLSPQWFISTYAHFIADHIPHIFKGAGSPEAALGTLLALIKSVILDATIILDSYGMSEELSLKSTDLKDHSLVKNTINDNEDRSSRLSSESSSRPLTKVQLTSSTVSERKEYVGLTQEVADQVHQLRSACQQVLPSMLDDFYNFFSSQPETAVLVPTENIPRLKRQLESYWNEFFTSEFDRPYAASRMMVGLVHDRIGLPLQWYMIGLAHQVQSLFKSVAFTGPDAISALDAFIRALFFDIAYVIDAYMEARTKRVLRSEGYAAQLIAGLTSAVIVVDGERRVVSVNQKLIEYLRIDSSLVYQSPVEQVLNVQALSDLLEKVQANSSCVKQKHSIVAKIANKVCRVTAIPLDPWEEVKGTPAAIVIDDISDIMKVAVDIEETDSHLSSIINSAELTVWEINIPTWAMELVSSPVLELTGYRDVYFIGRPNAWLNCLPDTDREKFKAYCETLPLNRKVSLEHRIVRADGQEVWARSFMKRSGRSDKGEKVFGVTVDISSEKYKEKQGDFLASALKREKTKSQVLSSISHEIRTPLNGVVGMLSFLMAGNSDASMTQHISSAHQSALDLLTLLNDILDMSKLEAGKMAVHANRFDIASLVESVEGVFNIQLNDKGLILRRNIEADLNSCWTGDASKIRQILLNLLSNAIKFTDEGSIQLNISRVPNGLKFTVSDTGIGIPREMADNIFQPFVQAHQSQGGTGLGLAICKQLAELMKGTLEYRALSPKGSAFELYVPLTASEPEPIPSGKNRAVAVSVTLPSGEHLEQSLKEAGWTLVKLKDPKAEIIFVDKVELTSGIAKETIVVMCGDAKPTMPINLLQDSVYTLGLSPLNTKTLVEILSCGNRRSREKRAFSGRVLVAEDNIVNQRVISLMLERLGFDVDVVMNGILAVDAAKQKAYELVFMDMLMPEMDGVQASTEIRSQGLNAKTPIIALTANAEDVDRRRCLEAGMNEVLIKPLQMSSLRDTISLFLH